MNLEPSGAMKPPTNEIPALSAAARILATICMAASLSGSGMLFGVVMSDTIVSVGVKWVDIGSPLNLDFVLEVGCLFLGLGSLLVIVLADPVFDR